MRTLLPVWGSENFGRLIFGIECAWFFITQSPNTKSLIKWRQEINVILRMQEYIHCIVLKPPANMQVWKCNKTCCDLLHRLMDTEHFAPSPTKDVLENRILKATKNMAYNNVSKIIYRHSRKQFPFVIWKSTSSLLIKVRVPHRFGNSF